MHHKSTQYTLVHMRIGVPNTLKLFELCSFLNSKCFDWLGITKTNMTHVDPNFEAKILDNPNIRYYCCNASPSLSGGLQVLWN